MDHQILLKRLMSFFKLFLNIALASSSNYTERFFVLFCYLDSFQSTNFSTAKAHWHIFLIVEQSPNKSVAGNSSVKTCPDVNRKNRVVENRLKLLEKRYLTKYFWSQVDSSVLNKLDDVESSKCNTYESTFHRPPIEIISIIPSIISIENRRIEK